MSDYVKPPRRAYKSAVRSAQTAATRRRILEAARALFVAEGYRSATVELIAADAGVTPKTVFHLFGSKIGVLKTVLDSAFVADDEPIPIVERTGPQQVKAERDQRRQIELAARGTAELLERITGIDEALAAAAAIDAEAAQLRADIELRQRKEAMRVLAGWLAETGPLKNGMSVERCADLLWVHTSPEVHRLFRKHCGWSAEQYAEWLTTTLLNAVAGHPGGAPS